MHRVYKRTVLIATIICSVFCAMNSFAKTISTAGRGNDFLNNLYTSGIDRYTTYSNWAYARAARLSLDDDHLAIDGSAYLPHSSFVSVQPLALWSVKYSNGAFGGTKVAELDVADGTVVEDYVDIIIDATTDTFGAPDQAFLSRYQETILARQQTAYSIGGVPYDQVKYELNVVALYDNVVVESELTLTTYVPYGSFPIEKLIIGLENQNVTNYSNSADWEYAKSNMTENGGNYQLETYSLIPHNGVSTLSRASRMEIALKNVPFSGTKVTELSVASGTEIEDYLNTVVTGSTEAFGMPDQVFLTEYSQDTKLQEITANAINGPYDQVEYIAKVVVLYDDFYVQSSIDFTTFIETQKHDYDVFLNNLGLTAVVDYTTDWNYNRAFAKSDVNGFFINASSYLPRNNIFDSERLCNFNISSKKMVPATKVADIDEIKDTEVEEFINGIIEAATITYGTPNETYLSQNDTNILAKNQLANALNGSYNQVEYRMTVTLVYDDFVINGEIDLNTSAQLRPKKDIPNKMEDITSNVLNDYVNEIHNTISDSFLRELGNDINYAGMIYPDTHVIEDQSVKIGGSLPGVDAFSDLRSVDLTLYSLDDWGKMFMNFEIDEAKATRLPEDDRFRSYYAEWERITKEYFGSPKEIKFIENDTWIYDDVKLDGIQQYSNGEHVYGQYLRQEWAFVYEDYYIRGYFRIDEYKTRPEVPETGEFLQKFEGVIQTVFEQMIFIIILSIAIVLSKYIFRWSGENGREM